MVIVVVPIESPPVAANDLKIRNAPRSGDGKLAFRQNPHPVGVSRMCRGVIPASSWFKSNPRRSPTDEVAEW
jgi:hypothetical protein